MKKNFVLRYAVIWALLFLFYMLLRVFIRPHEGFVLFIAHGIFLLAALMVVLNCYKVTQLYGDKSKHSDAFKIVLI